MFRLAHWSLWWYWRASQSPGKRAMNRYGRAPARPVFDVNPVSNTASIPKQSGSAFVTRLSCRCNLRFGDAATTTVKSPGLWATIRKGRLSCFKFATAVRQHRSSLAGSWRRLELVRRAKLFSAGEVQGQGSLARSTEKAQVSERSNFCRPEQSDPPRRIRYTFGRSA